MSVAMLLLLAISLFFALLMAADHEIVGFGFKEQHLIPLVLDLHLLPECMLVAIWNS
jgi:hypothetical protein